MTTAPISPSRARVGARSAASSPASTAAPARAAPADAARPRRPASAPQPRALLNTHNAFTDAVMPVLGAVVFAATLPYLAVQIALTTAWEALDVKVLGCGAAVRRAAGWRGWGALTQHAGDGFIAPLLLWLGVAMPLICVHEALHARAHGLSLVRVLLYNMVRIGPMYKGFAYLYTLAHKETHTFAGVFSPRVNALGAAYWFNWIAGPFFGVLPGTFTHSHQYNHHKYNNGVGDVYSTGGYARDSLWNFMRYIFVWFGYASNITTALAFVAERRYKWAAQVVAATLWYAGIVAALAAISPAWAAVSVGWAFVEGNVLLATVNWVWHAFISPEDPDDEFTASTTIVNGEQCVWGSARADPRRRRKPTYNHPHSLPPFSGSSSRKSTTSCTTRRPASTGRATARASRTRTRAARIRRRSSSATRTSSCSRACSSRATTRRSRGSCTTPTATTTPRRCPT